jgi:UDP-galactose transporter B1
MAATAPAAALARAATLLACVAGIYGAYLTQGVLQERLSTRRYGGARFPHLAALNAFQSWACAAWAAALLGVRTLVKHLRSSTPASTRPRRGAAAAAAARKPPLRAYLRPALSNCAGPALGFQALRYISYPAQVLAKSSKMLPVMALGAALHGKRYSAAEYACCLAITGGVALFAARSAPHAARRLAAPNAPLGYALCLLNLLLDGYTNVAQDEVHRRWPGGGALEMMAGMNLWSGLLYLPLLFPPPPLPALAARLFGLALPAAGREVLAFCAANAAAARDLALFCACGALGQLFIFATIAAFSSLTNTLVTTTRKFFSILGSVAWNGTPLAGAQWGAVGLVFGGLLASAGLKHRPARAAAPRRAKPA